VKVVLFCGGFGLRMRSHPDDVPKPMVKIGYRPILWHLMKYYAHFGHNEFILCLGWKADAIKQYFLDYDEALSNDFVLSSGGDQVELLNRDIQDWSITFVDTGVSASIGQRLRAVADHVGSETAFLANYTDGLTDLHLPSMIDAFEASAAKAMFLSVRPRHTFHSVLLGEAGEVASIVPIEQAGVWMNGGFFIFRPEIFDVLQEGEELVDGPFRRLIERRELFTYCYEGFWSCMDTFKEVQTLDDMYTQGKAVWEVWKRPGRPNGRAGLGAVEAVGSVPRNP
jgi:glucose-1-phosphate cytidylyltransferase